MRIDAYNQVAQLYGIQKSVKTQKAQNAAGPRDQVSISQAGRDYQVAKSVASDIRCSCNLRTNIPIIRDLVSLDPTLLKSIITF